MQGGLRACQAAGRDETSDPVAARREQERAWGRASAHSGVPCDGQLGQGDRTLFHVSLEETPSQEVQE